MDKHLEYTVLTYCRYVRQETGEYIKTKDMNELLRFCLEKDINLVKVLYKQERLEDLSYEREQDKFREQY